MSIKIKDIVRGNTRAINMAFVKQDGSAIDLTGGKVMFTVTSVDPPSDDTGAAIDKSTTSHTAPTLGQSRIVLAGTDTRITPGTYNCGAQAVLADGTVIENTGKVTILPDYKVSTT